MTLNAGMRGGTLLVTREDFNIEDIHCQMVYKIQRNNQLLKEIEGGPNDDYSMIMSTEEMMPQQPPQLLKHVEEEIICGDMCNKPAINWGRGRKQV